METNNNKLILLLLVLFCFLGCGQKSSNTGIEAYEQYLKEKLDYRDSLLIAYSVRAWSDSNWYVFEDVSRMYRITNDQVEYFIGGVFYSPDKLKIIVWIGEKMPNAETWEVYNKEKPSANRVCPQGKDTVYHMSALIGFREDTGKIWQLYPLDNQSASCFRSKEGAINVLGRYYFEKMKNHQMSYMIQSGNKKGTMELRAYDYNLQEPDFWEKCWLWEKDTVGAYGLYPFQVWSYRHPNVPTCVKCAEPLKRPKVVYPEEITRLYSP